MDMRKPDWRASLTTHRFLHIAGVSYSAPGILPAVADEKVIEASDITRWLRNWGYEFRATIGMYPPWGFIVPDPFEAGARQVVLREEVGEEFEGRATGEIHSEAAERIASHAREFDGKKNVKTVVLAVPTKIAANQIVVRHGDGVLGDADRLGISELSERVGALHLQRKFERRLSELNVPFISPVALYRDIQSRLGLLYPRGESHWSPVVVVEVAQLVVRELSRQGFFQALCMRDGDRFISKGKIHFLGDLYRGVLGRTEELQATNPFNSVIDKIVAAAAAEDANSGCPLITVIGSSYSVVELGGLDFINALRALYRGRVVSRSQPGVDPHVQLANASSEVEEGGIVLWEFPFRLVKRIE